MGKVFLYDQIRGSEEEKTLFNKKVKHIAYLLNTEADWLMLVMWFESRLNPAAVNSKSGATGLIQFLPSTAKGLGTTTEDLKQMSGSKQLEYVYKYFKRYKGKLNTLSDVYLTVFYPYAVGKPADYVLGSQYSQEVAENIANKNPIFDTDKDNLITKAEVTNYFTAWVRMQGYTGDVTETASKKKTLWYSFAAWISRFFTFK